MPESSPLSTPIRVCNRVHQPVTECAHQRELPLPVAPSQRVWRGCPLPARVACATPRQEAACCIANGIGHLAGTLALRAVACCAKANAPTNSQRCRLKRPT
jgi:hypothetical protein